MDMNGHVNNVIYFAWALETVPSDVYNNCHLYQVRRGCRCNLLYQLNKLVPKCWVNVSVSVSDRAAKVDALQQGNDKGLCTAVCRLV